MSQISDLGIKTTGSQSPLKFNRRRVYSRDSLIKARLASQARHLEAKSKSGWKTISRRDPSELKASLEQARLISKARHHSEKWEAARQAAADQLGGRL